MVHHHAGSPSAWIPRSPDPVDAGPRGSNGGNLRLILGLSSAPRYLPALPDLRGTRLVVQLIRPPQRRRRQSIEPGLASKRSSAEWNFAVRRAVAGSESSSLSISSACSLKTSSATDQSARCALDRSRRRSDAGLDLASEIRDIDASSCNRRRSASVMTVAGSQISVPSASWRTRYVSCLAIRAKLARLRS